MARSVAKLSTQYENIRIGTGNTGFCMPDCQRPVDPYFIGVLLNFPQTPNDIMMARNDLNGISCSTLKTFVISVHGDQLPSLCFQQILFSLSMKLLIISLTLCFALILAKSEDSGEDEDVDDTEEENNKDDDTDIEYYQYLNKRLKEQAAEIQVNKFKKAPVAPQPYLLPGPWDPLPGRSHNGDYWPLFPFSNQFHGSVDLDPSISRHLIADLNIPVSSWGMLDIRGRIFNRTSGTTTKYGFLSQPVNMLGLTKEDFTRLMSDPSLQHNRNIHPILPLGKIPKSVVPLSCRPPLCNPYTQTFAMGVEHDFGGYDGLDGGIDVPIPIGKQLAYRFPIGGNIYYDRDNVSVSYGHNAAPVDPYVNPFMLGNNNFLNNYKLFVHDFQKTRDRRSVQTHRSLYSQVPTVYSNQISAYISDFILASKIHQTVPYPYVLARPRNVVFSYPAAKYHSSYVRTVHPYLSQNTLFM
ncbi:hypothetical protein L596_020298 [Steinernema carpocapsae]|uniref:Uncharacterized protein n=1 Tax=Steinernema carpocapsae TaxID=34508 RepID=A0A4U5MT79_STECR|nr:hypothetical protein L596_020298 [Steinernema carpocapsae]